MFFLDAQKNGGAKGSLFVRYVLQQLGMMIYMCRYTRTGNIFLDAPAPASGEFDT